MDGLTDTESAAIGSCHFCGIKAWGSKRRVWLF